MKISKKRNSLETLAEAFNQFTDEERGDLAVVLEMILHAGIPYTQLADEPRELYEKAMSMGLISSLLEVFNDVGKDHQKILYIPPVGPVH